MYDPVFSSGEMEVLRQLGLNVLTENEVCVEEMQNTIFVSVDGLMKCYCIHVCDVIRRGSEQCRGQLFST